MATTTQTTPPVGVRCFCGNSLLVNPRARKAVVCTKCHQPLPLQAIRLALKARALKGR